MNTSSTDDYYTDTIWLVVAIPKRGTAQLLDVMLNEYAAHMRSINHGLFAPASTRHIIIPFDLPLPVLVKNALEALDDGE